MTYSYAKLGDIATYINGYAFKPKDHGTKGLPIIRIQDLTGSSNDRGYYAGEYPSKIEINNGDVLISWSASLGVYVWNKGKALLNQHIFKVKFDKKDIDKDYFVYAVRFNLTKLKQLTHGATMKHVVKKDFENVLIPYPSLKRQREIAYVLDKLERNLTQKSQELDKLDELIKARFVEMFGDPINNSKNWKLINIKKCCVDILGGGTPSKSHPEFFTGSVPWVTPKDMKENVITDSKDHITYEAISNSSAKLIPSNSVLMVIRSGILKHTLPVAINKNEVTINQDMKAFVPTSEISPIFLENYFIAISPDILSKVRSVTADNINFKSFQKRKIILPPISLQNEFANFVQQVDKSKFENIVYLNKTLSMKILGQLGDVFRD